MKFKLEIEIGNSAMATVVDVVVAIGCVTKKLMRHGGLTTVLSLQGCQAKIKDVNGNTVGHWSVDEEG